MSCSLMNRRGSSGVTGPPGATAFGKFRLAAGFLFGPDRLPFQWPDLPIPSRLARYISNGQEWSEYLRIQEQTRVVKYTLNPVWDEDFSLPVRR